MPKRISGGRGRRGDGAATRAQLLEAAGRLCAEKGFDRTTAKEIASRAGTNAAAVNYHFGGIEALYEAVLIEAHRRVVTLQAMLSVVEGSGDPAERLRRLLELIVSAVTGPAASTWAVRVLAREVLSPSPYVGALREREIEPKKSLLFGLVAELLGLPREHPAVTLTGFSIAAPFLIFVIADRRLVRQLFPVLDEDAESGKLLAEHMARFALAGIERMRQAEGDS